MANGPDPPSGAQQGNDESKGILAKAKPLGVQSMDQLQAWRYAEALVGKAEDDRKLRKGVAVSAFVAAAVQVIVADAVFVWYGHRSGWHIPGYAISAWLTATVVQVIAVAVVIAQSLFPRDSKTTS